MSDAVERDLSLPPVAVDSASRQRLPPPAEPALDAAVAPIAVATDSPPPADMPAVYILLGCLTLSALVIVSLLLYCVAQCWRQRCLGCLATSAVGRAGLPFVKVTNASMRSRGGTRECYYSMIYTNMNGAPPWMERNGRAPPPGSAQSNVSSATPTNANGGDDRSPASHRRRLGIDDESDSVDGTTRTPSGVFLFPPRASFQTSLGACSEDADERSMLHYELAYNSATEKNYTGCYRGTLTFALRYDFIHRVLMVHVLRANSIPFKDRSGTVDPYVKMYLLPERRNHSKTKIHKRRLDPEFNEMFSFDVAFNNLNNRMLQFTMYDFDRFARHDVIGNVIMRDLFEKSSLYNWTEYSMPIIGSNDKDDYGDLLLSLSYNESESKLVVTVSKAINLRPMDITGASDPYVRIEQVLGRKRVKLRKTTTKRANLNPVYHETLDFDLPTCQIDTTNLLIQVMDWDRIGRDDLLGAIIIGQEGTTIEGREQWRQCFEHSSAGKEQPGRWHTLLAEVPEQFRRISKK